MRARAVPLLAASLVVMASLGAVGVRAQTPASGVRMDVVRGYDGRSRGYAPNPITITIESDRIFSGNVEVEVPTGQTLQVYRRAIEVPGGSKKVIRLVVPRATVNEVRAVDRRGDVVARSSPNTSVLDSGESLVGVLTTLALDFDAVRIEALDRPAEIVAVAPEMIDLGAIALTPLSHFVVDATVVRRLSPAQVGAIAGYAAGGGELIVAAGSESELSFLPAAWRGAGGGTVRRTSTSAGAVTVALEPFSAASWGTGGAMWDATLRPVNILRWASTSANMWSQALAQSGGFRGASLGWLLTFLIVYIVLVGPVGFFVLSRMRRRELAWIVIPAIALLFAAGAFVAGRGFRSGPIKRGVAVAVVQPGSERVVAAVGLLSRGGGTERFTISDDWVVDVHGVQGGETPGVRFTGQDARAEIPLGVGDVGRAIVSRSRLSDHGRAGSVTQSGASLSADVRNVSGIDLVGASILVGQSRNDVGDLAAGATFKDSVLAPQSGFSDDEGYGYGGLGYYGGHGGYDQESLVLSVMARATAASGVRGGAFLTGTADLAKVGPAFGLPSVPGSIVVVMPLDIRGAATADVGPELIAPEVIATDGQINQASQYGDFFSFAGKEFTIRYTLPAGARPRSLYLSGHGLQQFTIKGAPGGASGGPQARSGNVISLTYLDRTTGSWRALTDRSGDEMPIPASALSSGGDVIVRAVSSFQGELVPYAFSMGARA